MPLSWFNKGGPGALALEEHPTQTIVKMINFGWDVCKYEAKGHFAIVNAFTESIGEYAKREKYVVKGVDDIPSFIDVVRDAIKDLKAQRVVIDSVTTLYLTKPAVARSVAMTLN
ncbi:MAG: ATPase domain-containing protein [Thermofilaceae archaeon]